jgi:CHAT domain-containing protein/tetratricopeptide (TPR) repeat protein
MLEEHAMFRTLCAALFVLASLACVSATRGSAATARPELMQGAAPVSDAAGAEPQTAGGDQDIGRDALRALLDQARKAKESNDPAGARSRISAAIERALSDIGEMEDAEALELLEGMGSFAQECGELRSAERARRRVLELRTRTLPEDHPELQRARGNLAATIAALGNLQGARALQEKVLEVLSRSLPEDHLELQWARHSLADTMRALGDLQGARALQEKVLEVLSRSLPDDYPDLQRARMNLAGTLYTLGDLQGARALAEKVLEVRSRTLPEDHPDLQTARLNLAITLYSLGDLEGAEALQEKVLEVFSRTLPDDHPDLQRARQGLAISISSLGDLQRARVLQEKVLEVLSRMLPDDHPDLQAARGNLAITIGSLGDLEGALALQGIALEVLSRSLPDDHPDLQRARLNFAGTLYRLGDLEGARSLFESVLEIGTRTLPDDHPDLLRARLDLAVALCALGDFQGARPLFEKSLEIGSRTLPDEHPDLQAARASLAVSIAAESARHAGGGEGKERCSELILELCRAQVRAVHAVLISSPSREAEERCACLGAKLDVVLSFSRGYGVYERSPALEAPSFVLSECARGAAIAAARLTREAVGSPRYAELREALVSASDELAGSVHNVISSESFDAAREKRERAERELIALARESSGGTLGSVDLEIPPLAKLLGAHAASVSFRRYRDWQISTVHPSTDRLCAFVVRGCDASRNAAGHLTLVDLGPIEPIETAVQAWREVIGAGPERGVGAGTAQAEAVRVRGEELRRLVFDPFADTLKGAERVVLALDDVLHLVPIEALPLEAAGLDHGAGLVLGDRYRFETRCSLTELLIPPSECATAQTLVSMGGASFNSTPLGATAEELAPLDPEKPVGTPTAAILGGSAWERGFSPLTYTGLEAREVAALFEEALAAGAKSVLLEKRKASRESLVELAPRARWLHVATHGWFAPESIRSWSDLEPLDKQSGLGMRLSGEEQVKGMNPMLLCGLALAGANLPEDAVGRVPGLVTAEEIAALDLSSCELAVLSACDTNVGKRRAGQGVASLQRALQMAGARSVITSLWKVPDDATRDLMIDFYRRIWIEKKPKHQALWEAKKKLRDAQDERGAPRHSTRDWAAWVLTGEPD